MNQFELLIVAFFDKKIDSCENSYAYSHRPTMGAAFLYQNLSNLLIHHIFHMVYMFGPIFFVWHLIGRWLLYLFIKYACFSFYIVLLVVYSSVSDFFDEQIYSYENKTNILIHIDQSFIQGERK